jgi:hypothetical protein
MGEVSAVVINAANVQLLLKGRTLIDNYRNSFPNGDSAKLISDIQALGFTDVSVFYKFNDDMCVAALQVHNIQGSCDLCKGYAGTPDCLKRYGRDSCYATGVVLTKAAMYVAILKRLITGDFGVTDDWNASIAALKTHADANGIYWYCRPGGGFYLNTKTAAVPPYLFSLKWR